MSTMFENHWYAEHTGKHVAIVFVGETIATPESVVKLLWAEQDLMCIDDGTAKGQLVYKSAIASIRGADEPGSHATSIVKESAHSDVL